jgi:hypothetical protein
MLSVLKLQICPQVIVLFYTSHFTVLGEKINRRTVVERNTNYTDSETKKSLEAGQKVQLK